MLSQNIERKGKKKNPKRSDPFSFSLRTIFFWWGLVTVGLGEGALPVNAQR